MGATLYNHEFFELVEDTGGRVNILVRIPGFSIQNFNDIIMSSVPRLKVTKFTALSAALREGDQKYIEIGELLPISQIDISSDYMQATVIIRLTPEEFANVDKRQLMAQIVTECKDKKIVYGLNPTEFVQSMVPMEPIVIAKGLLPVNGEDAIIKMYEIKEVEPTLEITGDVDHYEMNVINRAKEGEWLGERIEPTEGKPGINIHGIEVPAKPGQQIPLKFDPNTVISVEDEANKKTVLRALRNGAIVYQADMISILNSIDVDGDVCFATGNIDFDGFVEIKKTVEDNFSVIADENIQIMGDMGIGAVELIESRHGDVYIRGGVAGKNKAVIKAKKNVYTKFASDCTIECGGTLNIGHYAMNCDIKAKEVILESTDSKIIGGNIEADVKVIAGELGSRAGIPTKISVGGFDRKQYQEDYDKLNTAIELTKEKLQIASDNLKAFGKKIIKKSEYDKYDETRRSVIKYKARLKDLYDAQKNFLSYLKTRGDGEVKATKGVYQNVLISIVKDQVLIKEEQQLPAHYFFLDGEMKEE